MRRLGEHQVRLHHLRRLRRQQLQETPRIRRARGATDGDHQLQHDAHARQLLERVRAVAPLRIQDRVGVGQHPERLVVIGHDDVDAVLLGEPDLLGRRDPAIRGDDEPRPAPFRHVHAPCREAVSVPNAVGDEIRDLPAQAHEGRGQEGRGGDPVHVVIAVDQDGLALVDRLPDPRRGAVHVAHGEGVQEPIQAGFKEILNVRRTAEAAIGQKGGVRVGDSKLNGKLLGALRSGGASEHPGLRR